MTLRDLYNYKREHKLSLYDALYDLADKLDKDVLEALVKEIASTLNKYKFNIATDLSEKLIENHVELFL